MSSSAENIVRDEGFYFKCYYEIQPWNDSEDLFLCMKAPFNDHPPAPPDSLTVGVVYLQDGRFVPVSETLAWNFQQGCMPYWTGPSEILFNDRIDGEFRGVIANVNTRERTVLPIPVQSLTSSRDRIVSLNYARWGDYRPGYGYAGGHDRFHGIAEPREDTVCILDLKSGKARDLLCMDQVMKLTSDRDERRGSHAWFAHLMFNTDGTKLIGLLRWNCPELAEKERQRNPGAHWSVISPRRHCMWCINTDGTDLKIVVNDGLVSHAAWRDTDHVIAYASTELGAPVNYLLFDVRDGSCEVVGERLLTADGHMSYDGSKSRLLTDTYPEHDRKRTLKIYHLAEDREAILGRFHANPALDGEIRCDLHPSWNHDFTKVAFQSIHEDMRRCVYIVDV